MTTPFWARPRVVLAAVFAYLVVHFAVRMAMWHTLGIDDAEQALFAQEFALSYRNSAPPLFTWLLLGLGQAIGVNIVAISLIRYAFLAVVFVFAYLTARRLIRDPRLAALSVYSFAAIYVFAFYSHHDLTHTTAMTAMLALAWYLFVRLAEAPHLGWYLALGATFGLGLLGKWNFVMLAAALPLACLAWPAYRPLVLSWKVLPAILACAAITLPTALAVLLTGPDEQDTVQSVLAGDGSIEYVARVLEGTWRLAISVLAYPQPLLPLVLVMLGLPLWRGLRAGPQLANRAGSGSPRPDVAFISVTVAISLVLHLALVLLLGAREFSERLMQPPLFILPVLLFMLIERGGPGRRALAAFALVLALLVAGTLAARVAVYLRGADHCSSCRAMMPIAALSDQVRAAGFSGSGTIIAEGFHVGGNMRTAFPDARVIDAAYPPSVWPAPHDGGQCLLVWRDRDDPAKSEGSRRFVEAYLGERLGGAIDAPHREGVASALMFGSDTRHYRLGYRLYEGPTGDCR